MNTGREAIFPEPCGCSIAVTLTPQPDGDTRFNVVVSRCELHAAAPGMLAACKEAYKQLGGAIAAAEKGDK